MAPPPRLRSGVLTPLAAAILLLGLPACGGSSSPTLTSPIARFTPDVATPGAGTIAMLEGTRSGPHVAVRVAVTGVSSFFGAAFRVSYDPAALVFEGMDTSTSLLRQGGVADSDLIFLEDHQTSGVIVVTASRLDPTVVAPVDVTDTSDLVILKFGALKALSATSGLGRLDFADPKQVCDGTVALPGCGSISVTWSGGIVTAGH